MKPVSLRNKLVITIILFVLFYALLAIYSDIDKIKTNYQKINLSYVGPMLGILLSSMFLRSLLQRFFLHNIGIKISKKESYLLFLSGLSMLITPGGAGQVIKSHFIQKKYGYSISKSLPLVFAERFYDLVAIVVVVLFTLIFYRTLESTIIVFISCILLVVIYLVIKNLKFTKIFQPVLNKIRFLRNLSDTDSEFKFSLENFFQTRIIIISSFIAIVAFLLEGVTMYLGFLTFGIDLGYIKTFQVYYTSVLFGTISFIPGGVGILEGTFTQLLLKDGFDISLITSLIIFIRIVTMWFATVLGFVATYFTMSNKNKFNHVA